MTATPGERGTPHVDRLLAGLARRLRWLVVCHGLGTVLGVVSLWLAFAYLADWGLRVPKVVRIAHGLVLVGLLAGFVLVALLRPLRRIPGRKGLALLFERAHPGLRQLLVSAVQFQAARRSGRLEGDAQLVDRVLEDADARARTLDTAGILDVSRPRRRLLLGLAAAALVGSFFARDPQRLRILVDRMLGGSLGWPQETHLAITLPGVEDRGTVEQQGDVLVARVARGTDVPVVVRAEGVVPDDVRLAFEAGRDLVLPRTGNGAFRTLLRSVQEEIRFHATGGDDQDAVPSVRIEVLQPPDVSGIAYDVTPPGYSGLPRRLSFDHEVQVLEGSEVIVHVQPSPADAKGRARLLPSEEELALERRPFPMAPRMDDGDDGDDREGVSAATEAGGLAFTTRATESLGFRVELEDSSGLSNPDPALFRITVVPDRPPEVSVLAPARSDFEIVAGGAVPLRARAEDDLGVTNLAWRVHASAGGDEGEVVRAADFALAPVDASDSPSGPRHAAMGSALVEVDSLATESTPVAVDQRYVLHVTARDNREPTANEQEALPIRARVVTPEELLRRMQERLARARLDTVRLSTLQQEKRDRVEELVDALDGDGAGGAEPVALAAALSGQRRVLGDAEAIARDLAAIAEDILYARLDEKAGALLDFYHRRAAESAELRFRSEPWRALAAAQVSEGLGSGGFASNLVQLVGLALEIAEDHAGGATVALDAAERAADPAARIEALLEAAEVQSRCLTRIEDLLEELAEWDNFQNILTLTRDLLNRQKALRDRTQRFASEK